MKIYLVTNGRQFNRQGVECIVVKKTNRSKEVAQALEYISSEYEYILYTQDDYLLSKSIENTKIDQAINTVYSNDLAYLRLFPEPGKRAVCSNPKQGFEKIIKGSAFITSLQASIWNLTSLKELLVDGESNREFEMNSPVRTLRSKRDYRSVIREPPYPMTYYCTAIRRGKRRKKAVQMCINEGITLDFKYRKEEGIWDLFKKDVIYNSSPLWLKKLLINVFR